MPAPRSMGIETDQPSDVASFTKWLCRGNRVWAVDATKREELPSGWQTLARTLFDDIATVMAKRPAGMLIVYGLREKSGEVEVELTAIGATPNAVTAIRDVRALIKRAKRVSRETCSMCGAPGRVMSVGGRETTRCDAHAETFEVLANAQPLYEPDLDTGLSRRSVISPGELPLPGGAVTPDALETDHLLYRLTDVEAALGRRPKVSTDASGDSAVTDHTDDRKSPAVDSDQQTYLRALLRDGEAGCLRTLAHPEPAFLAGLDGLCARAPHMGEVIALIRRHLQAAITMRLPTSIPAIMLLGEPGTGKSWLLSHLARQLGVPYRRYPMNGQSLAEGLVGAYPSWRNAQPGLVAKCLLTERIANPLIMIDEVDKAGSRQMEDPYRGLYDLLEPEGAQHFTDEYLGVPIDASRVLWVLAGNDLAPLPAPIIDRLTIVAVPSLDEAQLRAVAASVYEECNEARRNFFRAPVDEAVIACLLETNPRGVRRAVEDAMTRAAAAGRRVIHPEDVVIPKPPRRTIGFR